MSWKLENADLFGTRFKRFQKNHSEEAKSALTNLQKYLDSLNATNSPLTVKFGFIHNEPDGIKAIDQKGGRGKNLMQTRLYVFPDLQSSILYVINIGTKQDQGKDIKECREFVKSIKKLKEEKNE